MTPRRLINHWAAGPLLLTLLAADLWWFGWHTRGYDDRREVADLVIDVLTSREGGGCGGGPPRLLTWRDGDCRLIGGGSDLSRRPPRPDAANSIVAVSWGRSSWGIIAPCQREDWITILNYAGYPASRLPSAQQVIGAVTEARLAAGAGLPVEITDNPPSVVPSQRKNVMWMGVVHDAIALPAWLLALSMLVCLPGRYVRWAFAEHSSATCRRCGYDTTSLLLSGITRCPECGQQATQ